MNERVWQLQGQAKVLAKEIVNQRKYDDYMEYTQSLMDETMNKLAELIVRECDRYVAEHYDETEPWMQPSDLLKHFGVEE